MQPARHSFNQEPATLQWMRRGSRNGDSGYSQPLARRFHLGKRGIPQVVSQPLHVTKQFIELRCGRFRGGGWCGGAYIGGEITQRHVHFVSNGGDDRNGHSCGGTHHALVIERPEIFAASATAAKDDNIRLTPPRDPMERGDE